MSSCPTRCVPLWSATTATGGSPGCWRRSTSTGSGSGRRPRATSSWKLSRSTPIEYGCATRRRPNMKRKQPTEPVPEGGGRVRRSWKKLALAAVALFVVFSVGRSVLPALGIGFPGGSKPGGPASTRAKNPPPPTVNLDGVMVPGSGQPLITLNPGLVRAGSTVAVNGSGFDPGSRVDLLLSSGKSQKAQQLATVTASKDGTIAGALPFPSEVSGGDTTREVTAQQRNSNKVAKAEAVLAQGTAQATLSAAAGKPGDTVALSAKGFGSGEDLGLYPTISVKPYAVKAAQRVGFSGKGFAPGERVLLHVNSAGGAPVAALTTDERGTFGNAGFMVPYELTGKQALVFIGEQSRATATAGFSILPYQPLARASTYGGLPGTALTFYAQGFAQDEAVHVYVGRGQGSQGEVVSAFRVDGGGKARSGGSYLIPGDASNQLTFTLVGARSKASATATVKVDNSGGSVDIPPQPKYTVPKDLER